MDMKPIVLMQVLWYYRQLTDEVRPGTSDPSRKYMFILSVVGGAHCVNCKGSLNQILVNSPASMKLVVNHM